jgi:MFS transporter, DHA1 family, multidrug resistance protein
VLNSPLFSIIALPSTMDIVDRELEKAERDASRERYPRQDGVSKVKEVENTASPITRTETASTGTSTSSSTPSVTHRSIPGMPAGMSRMATQRDLERHPTELSRINTQRSQHSQTVGASLRPKQSRKPLPEFGAGKPYPPPLPEREEYVVEFDGPSDPMHAMNWPLSRK